MKTYTIVQKDNSLFAIHLSKVRAMKEMDGLARALPDGRDINYEQARDNTEQRALIRVVSSKTDDRMWILQMLDVPTDDGE